MAEQQSETRLHASLELADSKECFIVMPFGRDADEQRWFRGWFETVIHPAVASCGFEPVLAAAQDQPSAINDEIRSHLVFDPMVVVDLGGTSREDPPNPNVMYELGIRHAFGKALVLMAWDGQQLPFDVNNQRAILSRRDFLDLEPTRVKLARFIRAAQEGRYYNPMEAVGREAAIDTTSLVLGEESLLAALAKEVKELRNTVLMPRQSSTTRWRRPNKVKLALGRNKEQLWEIAKNSGIDPNVWSKFLSSSVPPDMQEEMGNWSINEWSNYLTIRTPEIMASGRSGLPTAISETFLEEVREKLPTQPWPTGIHKIVSTQLDVPQNRVSRAIQELIKRGVFSDQIYGVVVSEDAVALSSANAQNVVPAGSEPAETSDTTPQGGPQFP